VRFIPDPNAALASLRADEIQLAVDNALQFEQAQALKRDWSAQGDGSVLLDLVEPRVAAIQFRPSVSSPRSLLDARVRRALIASLDRQEIVDALFDGEVPVSDQLIPRTAPSYAEVERAIRRYTHDARQAEQLMGEAGYQKGAGSSAFTNSAGERFAFESWTRPGREGERLSALLAQSWRQAGFDVTERQLTPDALSDARTLASFPSLSSLATPAGELALAALVSEETPGADTGWRGLNWGGWSNPQYDLLWSQFNTTLDRTERNRQVAQMMQVATEEVAVIPLFHNPAAIAFVAGLRGPEIGVPDRLPHWNIHQWELQ
jgi:peptide/nickel transport system substrate-binding protein